MVSARVSARQAQSRRKAAAMSIVVALQALAAMVFLDDLIDPAAIAPGDRIPDVDR